MSAVNPQILTVADTTALQAKGRPDSLQVLVENIGIFNWALSGTPNGSTIFSANGGGVWKKVLAPGSGNALVTLTDATTTTWDYNEGNCAEWTIADTDRTLDIDNVPSGIPAFGVIKITQGAGGNFRPVLPGNSDDIVWRLDEGEVNLLRFYYDGTDYHWTSSFSITAVYGAQLDEPGNFSATATNTTINLDWDSVTGATSYRLQRSTDPTFKSGVVLIYTGSGSSYSDAGLDPTTQYYYRVKAKASGYADSLYSFSDATTTVPFDVAAVSSVKNWWDITDNSAIVITSGRVHQMTDKKGSRNIATTQFAYPTYSASGGSNNKAFITIDPTQAINTSAGSWTGTGGCMAFLVMRLKTLTPYLNGLGDYRNVILGYSGRNAGVLINNLTYDYAPCLVSNTGVYNSSALSYMAHTDWQILCVKTFAGLTEFFPNNQPSGTTCKTTLDAMTPTEINIGSYSMNAEYEMSELIFADSTLSVADEKSIVNYLLEKYNITPKPFLQCYGDSLTAGNCNPSQSWPLMVADGNGLQLVNFGYPSTIVEPNNGSTGVSGANFADKVSTALKWPYADQWVTVNYGVNDTNAGGINATWKSKYKAIIQQMLDWGYDPARFILTIPPSTSSRQSTMAQTNTYISEIASEMGLILFDCNALFLANGGDSLFADSLHPNTAGNTLTANAITAIISA